MRFKNYFQKLSLFQKLELYILVLLFYSVIFYFYDEIAFQMKDQDTQNSTILDYQKKYNSLHLKMAEINDNEILTFIEKEASKNNLLLHSLLINSDNIAIKCSGDFTSIVTLLQSCQTHLLIKNFQLSSVKNKIYCDFQVGKNYFYNTNLPLSEIKKPHNPFFQVEITKEIKEQNITKEPSQNSIKIIPLAIVSNEVLLLGKWYKVGEVIGNEKIVAIDTTTIQMKNIKTKHKYTVKVKNE